jgi:hypothetical protein
MGWRSQEEIGPDRTIHIWPEYEEGHVVDGSAACPCRPDPEFYENGNIMVVHRDELDRLEIACR